MTRFDPVTRCDGSPRSGQRARAQQDVAKNTSHVSKRKNASHTCAHATRRGIVHLRAKQVRGAGARSGGGVVSDLQRIAVTKAEAAETLGCSVDFLEEHVMPELRVIRRGRKVLIPVRELERWADQAAAVTLQAYAAG